MVECTIVENARFLVTQPRRTQVASSATSWCKENALSTVPVPASKNFTLVIMPELFKVSELFCPKFDLLEIVSFSCTFLQHAALTVSNQHLFIQIPCLTIKQLFSIFVSKS